MTIARRPLLATGDAYPALHGARAVEEQRFDSADVPIHSTEAGRDKPVVLVHGCTVDAGVFGALPEDFRVDGRDARGHGRGGEPYDPAGIIQVERPAAAPVPTPGVVGTANPCPRASERPEATRPASSSAPCTRTVWAERADISRLLTTVAMLLGLTGVALAQAPVVNPGTPAPDCATRVNFDRNADLPGYLIQEGGRRVCIPFMPIARRIPAGGDAAFYVRDFTDAAIRARYTDCVADAACAGAARGGAATFTSAERRRTGSVGSASRIDPHGEVDLRAIRRPAFFEREGRSEPIAAAEPRTHVVEFTVPRDPYERLHLRREDPIRLRGWYIEGAGVADGASGTRRALVVMNNGGGNEITGIDDPTATGVARDAQGRFVASAEAGASEQPGMRHWRGFAAALNAAGFDVLVTDRRGNGISGGLSGFNTLEQARDMVRQLEALEGGAGLRILTPAGEVLSGDAARGRLLAGMRAREVPVVIVGYSRGSYAAAWAMHRNVVADCDRDIPGGACRPPLGWGNVRGAILYGPNAGGLGTRAVGHDMIEAALRVERNTAYYPDGEVLEGIARWPAVMIARGTWDYVEGLEGSLEAHRRARGLKEIVVFRGPHQLSTQHEENMRFVGRRMAAFARAAVLGHAGVEESRTPADLRGLVLSSPAFWEHTTEPSN